jgi:penicillin G amidase
MPKTLHDRLSRLPLSSLPLQHKVTIRWNEHAVPYIDAESDRDLAFTLGLVHAHLREGQLALGKRLAYGRLSEIIGPLGWKLDHALRTLGFARAAELAEPGLPEASRVWLEDFARGLNHYQDRVRKRPPEYRLLGIRRERWVVRDLLAIGRVAGTDINWLTFFNLLKLRDRPDFPRIWQRALAASSPGIASFLSSELAALLEGATRPGSNCVVVSGRRSASGGALLASDPHLSLILPNLWLLAGVRSPSLNAVGLMPVGLPIFGLGRSEHMAWGGTNMRAAASDLFDVSREPPGSITARPQVLRTRFWARKRFAVRESRFGPLISDVKLFGARKGEMIALRWAGQEKSDEIGAFLAAARARTAEEFRAAFACYGVGGQNMQFADRAGNIGQVMAVWLPRRRPGRPHSLVQDAADPAAQWQGFATAAELPWVLNPLEGFLASANNLPTATEIPVGHFFITPERVERLQAWLGQRERISLDDLRVLQRDTISPASHRLATILADALDQAGLGEAVAARLRGWDGRYDAEDVAPVAFETLLYHVVTRLDMPRQDWSTLVAFLPEELEALAPAARAALLGAALAEAQRDASRFASWGEMHRMRAQHILARVPLLGRRYRVAEYPSGGSRETVMKAAHGLVRKRHAASYGSQARFLADMSDPDANFAILFGGQDGWIGAPNYADQLPLWRAGEYVRLPLSRAAVERDFSYVQQLTPAA